MSFVLNMNPLVSVKLSVIFKREGLVLSDIVCPTSIYMLTIQFLLSFKLVSVMPGSRFQIEDLFVSLIHDQIFLNKKILI